MAEEEQNIIGGYQCEFVGPVPEELLCKECKLVARKPHITGCCSEHFCHACIDPVLKDKKPCPSCGEAEFSTLFMRKNERKNHALQVYCTVKKRGCKWAGPLKLLDAHLNIEKGDCDYVDVKCAVCDRKVQKRKLGVHIIDDCPQREYMCPHCNFKATFEIVSEEHWPECLEFPLRCPNQCGVTCEREVMQDHMKMCSLEEVECEVSFAGCKEKFLREDQDKHMERTMQKHLTLMATATVRISREFEQTLQEKDKQIQQLRKQVDKMGEDFQKALLEKDKQIKSSAMEVAVIKTELNQAKEKLAYLYPLYSFTIPNFTTLKKANGFVFSEVFSTHLNGYDFAFGLRPNGPIGALAGGSGTHVYVWMCAVPGEFDDTLSWPAKVTLTLVLLNQCSNREHVTLSKKVGWPRPFDRTYAATLSRTFKAHDDLAANPKNKTEYLKDDCLKFIVTDIVVEK